MYSPALLPPTKEIALIIGSKVIYLVVSNPPCTILKTPLGNPTSFKYLANKFVTEGTFSDGFNTMVFPVVIAIGIIQQGIMNGKLKGQTPPTTPNGVLKL